MPRSNPNPSPLTALTGDQQQQIIAWLESDSRRNVLQRLAKSPPEGFGIQTHPTILNRFYARHLAKDRHADLDLAEPRRRPRGRPRPSRHSISRLESGSAAREQTTPQPLRLKAMRRWASNAAFAAFLFPLPRSDPYLPFFPAGRLRAQSQANGKFPPLSRLSCQKRP